MDIHLGVILLTIAIAVLTTVCLLLLFRLRRLYTRLNQQTDSLKHLAEILKTNERVLKEKLILRLCYNTRHSEQESGDVISHYQLQEFLDHAAIVLIRFTDITPLSSTLHRDAYYLAQQELSRACHDAAEPFFPSFWLWENPSTVIGVLSCTDTLTESVRLECFSQLGNALQQICLSDKWNSPVIAFGGAVSSSQELFHSYDQAAELLNHKIHTHTVHPYSYEEFRRTELQFDYNKQSLLARYVLLGKTEDGVKLLSSWFSVVHANPDTSVEFVKDTALQILHSIRIALEKKPGIYAAALPLLDEAAREVGQFSTVHQIGEYMADQIQRLCESTLSSKTSKGKVKTDQLIQWMNANYNRDISLEDMAAQIGCSVSYTSKLFKKETGRDISAYLSSLRIAHAKELLTTTHLSLAEIAAAVGFNNQQTLIRNFKSLTGLTPTEFRNNPETT